MERAKQLHNSCVLGQLTLPPSTPSTPSLLPGEWLASALPGAVDAEKDCPCNSSLLYGASAGQQM